MGDFWKSHLTKVSIRFAATYVDRVNLMRCFDSLINFMRNIFDSSTSSFFNIFSGETDYARCVDSRVASKVK